MTGHSPLRKLWVSKEPNRSHYRESRPRSRLAILSAYIDIWDNRVVPTFIDSREHPLASAMFHIESTACYEQALQSVIVRPEHDERILLVGKGSLDGTYSVEGYAFNGGGDRIDRVELSLDGGKTWRWCLRRFVDSPLRSALGRSIMKRGLSLT